MFDKQFRFNIIQLVFNYIFRLEGNLDHNLRDILLTSTTNQEQDILSDVINAFEDYKNKIKPFLTDFGWDRTPILSRAILITFCQEQQNCKPEELAKVVADYLHLTQDLAGADSVPLVHAVIGKITL